MFKDFEERFSPKTIADIVYSDDETKGLIEDLVSGARPFPVTASKCGILLYGLPGTGVTFHHIEANPFSAFRSHPVFGI